MKKLSLYLLLAAFFVLAAFPQEGELTTLSSSIRDRLTDLKVQSANMTLLCETLQNDLETSQAELQTWKEQSTRLSDSLTNINEQLNESFETITRYERRLKTKTKVLIILVIILVLRTIGMLVGYWLYYKGIRLPRWLDLLL